MRAIANILQVIGRDLRNAELAKVSLLKEVDEMRATRLWNTYRRVRLEKSLIAVPRTERRALRAFVTGKKTK